MSAPPSRRAARAILEPRGPRTYVLPSGRSVAVAATPIESVRVTAADGTVEIEIVLTPDGPVLRGRALRLELDADAITLRGREVRLEADHLHLTAREDVVVHADHDVVATAGAHIRLN